MMMKMMMILIMMTVMMSGICPTCSVPDARVVQVAMLSQQVHAVAALVAFAVFDDFVVGDADSAFPPQVVLLAERIQHIDVERKSRRSAAKP